MEVSAQAAESVVTDLERLREMTDDELVVEATLAIEETAAAQAYSALIKEVQKARNIERSATDAVFRINRVASLVKSMLKDDPKNEKLGLIWIALKPDQ